MTVSPTFLRLTPAMFVLLWSSGWIAAGMAMLYAEPLTFLSVRFALAAGILGTRLPGPGSVAITNYIRYRRPIFAGDAITTRIEVVAIDRERRCATFAMTFTNGDGEVVALGEAVLRPPGN
jgi:acyl dehydratase